MIDSQKQVAGRIAAVIACLLLASCGESTSSAHPAASPPAPEVSIISLRSAPLQLSTVLPGRTKPNVVAEVRPQVGGILLKRTFREGTDVKMGEVLYEIDPAPYRAALMQAEASFESIQSRLRRYETLVKAHAISQQQYDDARSEYLKASAAIKAARIDLGYTKIRAPISGRIGRSSLTQGALVTANQSNALATIQQLDPMYVDIVQPAISLMQLRDDLANGRLKSDENNQADVRLRLENGREYPYTGKLQFSEVSVDESTGSVTLRAIVPNPDGALLPGLFVRAELGEGVQQQAILIPQRAVSRDSQGNTSVWIVGADDTVKEKSIGTDRVINGQWLVSEGLNAGARVIVDGIQHVSPGLKVKPVELSTALSQRSPTHSN